MPPLAAFSAVGGWDAKIYLGFEGAAGGDHWPWRSIEGALGVIGVGCDRVDHLGCNVLNASSERIVGLSQVQRFVSVAKTFKDGDRVSWQEGLFALFRHCWLLPDSRATG